MSAAVHLALNELESGDLPFNLAIAPWLCQASAHGGEIALKRGGKIAHLDDAAAVAVLEPRVKAVSSTLAHHHLKLLREIPDHTNVGLLENVPEERGFDRVQVVFRAQQHPDEHPRAG